MPTRVIPVLEKEVWINLILELQMEVLEGDDNETRGPGWITYW